MFETQKHTYVGLALIALFFGTFGVWATFTTLQGAVVSTGEIAFTDNRTIDITHEDGGLVLDVHTSVGSHVEAGDVMVTLNPELLMIEAQIYNDRLFEAEIRKMRYTSLLNNTPFPDLPNRLAEQANQREDLKTSLEREKIAYQTHIDEWQSTQNQYEQRKTELETAVDSLLPIATGVEREIELLSQDLETTRQLFDNGNARRSALTQLERNLINAQNTLLRTKADIANNQTQIQGIAIALEREHATRQTEIVQQLSLLAEKIPEINERLNSIQAQIRRLTILAPISGTVNELSTQAAGVNLLPGTVVAKLVPQSQAPQVITRIEPSQIDQVYLGQEALLRPMTRNQNDLEVQAKITRVAEALKNDPNTGAPYYEVVLEPSLEAFYERGGEAISGTPFEVAIQTQARTPWEYFMEPIKRSFRRSLRE